VGTNTRAQRHLMTLLFRHTHLCIEIPLCIRAVGIFQCGSLTDENPGQLRVEINRP
jgi:hypothetical protein